MNRDVTDSDVHADVHLELAAADENTRVRAERTNAIHMDAATRRRRKSCIGKRHSEIRVDFAGEDSDVPVVLKIGAGRDAEGTIGIHVAIETEVATEEGQRQLQVDVQSGGS